MSFLDQIRARRNDAGDPERLKKINAIEQNVEKKFLERENLKPVRVSDFNNIEEEEEEVATKEDSLPPRTRLVSTNAAEMQKKNKKADASFHDPRPQQFIERKEMNFLKKTWESKIEQDRPTKHVSSRPPVSPRLNASRKLFEPVIQTSDVTLEPGHDLSGTSNTALPPFNVRSPMFRINHAKDSDMNQVEKKSRRLTGLNDEVPDGEKRIPHSEKVQYFNQLSTKNTDTTAISTTQMGRNDKKPPIRKIAGHGIKK